jgi:hypothetical protein
MTGMISRYVRPSYWTFFTVTFGLQNDMLMWLMEEAKGVERSLEGLARRLLLVNFAAIHSTSLVSNISSSLLTMRS